MPRTPRWRPGSKAFASIRKARWATSASWARTPPTPSSNLPFLAVDRERFLEYDVTKLVVTLANQRKSTIGLISGIPVEGSPGMPMMGRQPTPPLLMIDHIKEFFEVKSIAKDAKEIPSDIGVLIVVQPEGLSADLAYAIDQFALAGGKVLAFVDPVPEMQRQGQMMFMMAGPPDLAEFGKLLKTWGVAFDTGKVAADKSRARRVQFGGGPRASVTDYIVWMGLDRRNLDERDVLAGGIERLNFASAGFLEKAADSKTEFSPIVRTTADAMVLPADAHRHDAGRRRPAAQLQARRRAAGGCCPHLRRGQERVPRRGACAAACAGSQGQDRRRRRNGQGQSRRDQGQGERQGQGPGCQAGWREGAGRQGAGQEGNDRGRQGQGQEGRRQESRSRQGATGSPRRGPTSLRATSTSSWWPTATSCTTSSGWTSASSWASRWRSPMPTTASFVLGALENLSGSDALISLRGRGVTDRPFELVNELRRDAEQRFRDKEQVLTARLREVQGKLAGLEKQGDGENLVLSDKDRQEIEKFRGDILAVRRELREVKRELRKDIDRLDGALKFVNIAAVPLLIGLAGIGWADRRRRSKPHPATSPPRRPSNEARDTSSTWPSRRRCRCCSPIVSYASNNQWSSGRVDGRQALPRAGDGRKPDRRHRDTPGREAR